MLEIQWNKDEDGDEGAERPDSSKPLQVPENIPPTNVIWGLPGAVAHTSSYVPLNKQRAPKLSPVAKTFIWKTWKNYKAPEITHTVPEFNTAGVEMPSSNPGDHKAELLRQLE